MSTELVTLRTGKQVPEIVVRTTTIALQRLAEVNPIALIELVSACKDPSHVPWGDSAEALRALAMVTAVYADGTVDIHDATRDIVLASTEGEDLTLALCSPYAEAQQ